MFRSITKHNIKFYYNYVTKPSRVSVGTSESMEHTCDKEEKCYTYSCCSSCHCISDVCVCVCVLVETTRSVITFPLSTISFNYAALVNTHVDALQPIIVETNCAPMLVSFAIQGGPKTETTLTARVLKTPL